LQHFFEGDYPQASVDSFFVTIVLCTFYQMTLAGCNNSMITLGCLMIQHNQLLLAVAVRSLLKPLFSK
jgi:hypothetical protein